MLKYHNIMIFTRIEIFFLNKYSSHCCKPVANFQSSKKLFLTDFGSVSVAFIDELLLGGICFTILKVLSLCGSLK